jgi:hypothetical protein
MEDALLWVVLGAVAVGVLCALAAAVARGSAYDHIGRGGLSLEEPAPPATGAGAAAARDEEVRQMLRARNARRARRGQPELDVEAEVVRLSRPRADPALAAELRELALARNRRRARRGQPPLDIEAEVERHVRRPPM